MNTAQERWALTLLRYFPWGGQQRDMLRVASYLLERGEAVTVICHQWASPREAVPPGLEIVELPARGLSNHAKVLAFQTALDSYFAQREFDYRLTFGKFAGHDAWFAADACLAHQLRDAPRWKRWLPRYRSYLRMEARVVSGTPRPLFITAAQRADYEACYGHFPHAVTLQPNVGERFVYTPARDAEANALRASHGVADDDFVALFVASSFMTKGLDRVLGALAALPASLKQKTHLWVVGNDHLDTWRQRAQHICPDVRIVFHGARNDVDTFYVAADVLLHPARNEAAGMVLMEAWASGLPVICTALCGYATVMACDSRNRLLGTPFVQVEFDQVLHDFRAAFLQRTAKQAPPFDGVLIGNNAAQIVAAARGEKIAQGASTHGV